MRGWRALDGGRWLDPTQARQGTEATRAAVSMSGGSPEAGRQRGYVRVEALAADRSLPTARRVFYKLCSSCLWYESCPRLSHSEFFY